MNKYICIHGHFYQPPRENPWLEEVEWQEAAYPYHDWNEKITAECYAPNATSRILDPQKKIIDIVNNYNLISFNFGPTLLSWLEKHEPEVYQAILNADRLSQSRFNGHGSALAQVYNHIIMPLANQRDKRTQVIWGIKDFEHRFGRKPEGMWLSETAVDIETLEILAEQGIKFTILAPRQARRVRPLPPMAGQANQSDWQDVSGERINAKQPYLCSLPSGKIINIFFDDGPISRDIAFGDLLKNGENFARKLVDAFNHPSRPGETDQLAPIQSGLINIATDGETYGHHHRFGDMALAYCLYYIESNKLATITIYGEYLEKHPPSYEVEIIKNSSWSCIHGVERWRNNCGCRAGKRADWQQNWRMPLREAMDWLRDNLCSKYEEQMARYVKNPWAARDDYLKVIIDRSTQNIENFLASHSLKQFSREEKVIVLKLLEMQRQLMLMYTSCGWFFEDISGIETVQVIQYAARAMQLGREVTGVDLEPGYLKFLERAPSNIPELANGAKIYNLLAKPVQVDLIRAGAHYAISSLFEEYPETAQIYCYSARNEKDDRLEMGNQKLAVGQVRLYSDITWEEMLISYAVLHLGDHNLIGGVRQNMEETAFNIMHDEIKDAYLKSNITEVIYLIDKHFETHNYSLWHLFKDEQKKILGQIAETTLKEIEASLRQIYQHYYPIMQVMNKMKIPLPKALSTIVEFVFNTQVRELLENGKLNTRILQKLAEETKRRPVELDRVTLGFVATGTLTGLMEKFSKAPDDLALLETIASTIKILSELPLELDTWKMQNIYFATSRRLYKEMTAKANQGNTEAEKWIEYFTRLGGYLQIKNA
ncbi:MAG: DUF3536 domain-containing protein [Planctomycetota bacterium]